MTGGWLNLPSTISQETPRVIPPNADNARDTLRTARAARDAQLSLDLELITGAEGTGRQIRMSDYLWS